MKKTKATPNNLLEMIPVKSERYQWEKTEDNLVQIIIPRDSMLERAVRLFFKTPEVMRIDLDATGSLVWESIDNHRTVSEIGEILRREMKDQAEPLYERLGTYLNLLKNNHFITFKSGDAS